MRDKTLIKKINIVILSGIVFYMVSVPFRDLLTLNAVTEVRPASAFPMVFGLIWGFPGALGVAIGNLLADIQSGYNLGIVAIGFLLQFLYGYIPHIMWYKLPLKNETKASYPTMDSTAHILKYLFIDLVCTVGMALSLGITMEAFSIGKIFSMATLAMLLNNLVFTIILGIPLLIAYSVKKSGRMSLNARVAIFCLMIGIFASVLVGLLSYYRVSSEYHTNLLIWNSVFFSSFTTFIILFGISIFFLRYMEKQVTIPAEELSKAAIEYFAEGVDEPDHDAFIKKCQSLCNLHSEIGTLAKSSSRMAKDLQNYMIDLKKATAEQERINTELNVAKQIQISMLPSSDNPFPNRDEFEIHASMEPAREVGGDFYDFFLVDEDHLALVIADVSGKGMPAALFMVITKTLIKNNSQVGASPKEILEKVNNQLCENNDAEMFVTVWMGILEISTGKITCVNAGHEYPAIYRAGGEFELLKDKHGFVLAGMENIKYKEYEIELNEGDAIYVYTDGIPEATNNRNELFGTDRMIKALNKKSGTSPKELLPCVKKEINSFVGDAPQFDDITMTILTYYGKEEKGA